MSGEFTPTTEQVRDGYRYDPEAEYHDPITPHHVTNGRAFDRWYAAEIAAAEKRGAVRALREAAEAVESAATPNCIGPSSSCHRADKIILTRNYGRNRA